MNPVLFVSHGAPNLVLRDTPHSEFLRDLGHSLPRPESVIVLSAHWYAPNPKVGSAPRPQTIHDFSGFSSALSAKQYAAQGDPQLALRLCDRLRKAGMAVECDPDRGLDHGMSTTLSLMYPEADVRVVGAARRGGDVLHEGFDYGNLAMHAFAFWD